MTNEITQFKYEQLDESTADFLRQKESSMRPTRKSLQSIKTEKMKKDPYCWVCRIGVSEILELHHILPVKNGGEDSESNTILLCPNCHAFTHFLTTDRAQTILPKGIDIEDALDRYSKERTTKNNFIKLMNKTIEKLEAKTNKINK